jgi:hypothetical protein
MSRFQCAVMKEGRTVQKMDIYTGQFLKPDKSLHKGWIWVRTFTATGVLDGGYLEGLRMFCFDGGHSATLIDFEQSLAINEQFEIHFSGGSKFICRILKAETAAGAVPPLASRMIRAAPTAETLVE